MHGKREKVAMFGMPSQRWFDQLTRRTVVEDEKRDFRTNKTLTERVAALENDFYAGGLKSGCEESILGQRGPRDELGSRDRFAEREKEQHWRNEQIREAAATLNVRDDRDIRRGRYHETASYAGEPAPAPTAFEEIMNRIQHCTDRVIGTSQRLERISERVFGPLPETMTGCDAAKVNPDGTLDHTLLALNWLDGAIARLEMAEARLSGI
jgi:hypothetical protein